MTRIKLRAKLLYFFLFTGVFNDIIRVGGTQITLFRVLLPAVFLLTFIWSKRARKLYLVFLLLAVVSLIQSVVFCAVNSAGVTFELGRYVTYLFYYLCIIVALAAVAVIYETDTWYFARQFETFLIVCGVCYLCIFMMIRHISNAREYLNINNQNDYGAMLAMLAPVFYYRSKTRKKNRYICLIPFILLYLMLNDCKLALLGVAFQIVLVIYFQMRERAQNWRFLLIIPGFVILGAFLYFLSDSDVQVNGYDWRQTVLEPVKAIFTGQLYNQSNTSVTYRVNTFIVSVHWMIKTRFLGIGIGNSGMLVRNLLGDQALYESWMMNNAVSLHNAFLEVGLEFGLIAIAGLVSVIRSITRILKYRKMTDDEACLVVITLSSVLWLQGPSGILVDYLIFITFGWLILRNRITKFERKWNLL